MKIFFRILVILIFFIAASSLAGQQTIGHAGFFFVSPVRTPENSELHDDFQYHYKQIIPWLIKNGLSFSYHATAPITLNLDDEKTITVQKEDLKEELGFILAKRDGPARILYGVHTDVDILMAVKDFFDISAVNQEAKAGAGEKLVAQKVAAEMPETNLIQLIRNSSIPVLIYIISGEASLDKRLEATLRQLKSDYKNNIRMAEIDPEKDYEILNPWRRFEIDDVPTVILFSGGKEQARLVGEDDVTRNEIYRMLRKAGVAASLPQIRCHNLYIGVLEQRKSNWPREPSKDDRYEHRVRILFAKSDSGWESVLDCPDWQANYPQKVEWTVAFDGRDFGKLESEDVPDSAKYANFYARDKIHKPNSKYKIPKVGKPTTEFSGWIDEAYLRPLVLVSDKNYKDPQKWKPFKPSQSEISRIIPVYREFAGRVMRCQEGSHKMIPFNYTDEDLNAFKSYRAVTGDALISVGFRLEQTKCGGGSPDDPQWQHWFYLSPEKEVAHIGDRMRLVDAGDYDSDGVSEVIFWTERYNRDGYVLFYKGFAKNTDYLWSYH
jgi:hypothetical protein